MFGVAMSDPKLPRWAKPVSSRTIATTLGEPAGGFGTCGWVSGNPATVNPAVAGAEEGSLGATSFGATGSAGLAETENRVYGRWPGVEASVLRVSGHDGSSRDGGMGMGHPSSPTSRASRAD